MPISIPHFCIMANEVLERCHVKRGDPRRSLEDVVLAGSIKRTCALVLDQLWNGEKVDCCVLGWRWYVWEMKIEHIEICL